MNQTKSYLQKNVKQHELQVETILDNQWVQSYHEEAVRCVNLSDEARSS